MQYRIEKDTMGEVKVPADKLWAHKRNVPLKILKLDQRLPCHWKSFMVLHI